LFKLLKILHTHTLTPTIICDYVARMQSFIFISFHSFIPTTTTTTTTTTAVANYESKRIYVSEEEEEERKIIETNESIAIYKQLTHQS
jgi:hypothetical protein